MWTSPGSILICRLYRPKVPVPVCQKTVYGFLKSKSNWGGKVDKCTNEHDQQAVTERTLTKHPSRNFWDSIRSTGFYLCSPAHTSDSCYLTTTCPTRTRMVIVSLTIHLCWFMLTGRNKRKKLKPTCAAHSTLTTKMEGRSI